MGCSFPDTMLIWCLLGNVFSLIILLEGGVVSNKSSSTTTMASINNNNSSSSLDVAKGALTHTTLTSTGSGSTTPLSMAAESAITFISVFIVGCVIIIFVYAWKKYTDSSSSIRTPHAYQYSALSQFDNDPDEEVNDLEDNLEMLVDDSTDSDAAGAANEDVFHPPPTQPSVTTAMDKDAVSFIFIYS